MILPRFSSPAVDIQVVSVPMFYMATVFLLLSPMFIVDTIRSRAHIRCFKTRVEDSIMIFALCFSSALCILLLIMSLSGFDHDANYRLIIQDIYPSYIGSHSSYRAASTLAKVAIIFQFMKSYEKFWQFAIAGIVIAVMTIESVLCIGFTLFAGKSWTPGSYTTSSGAMTVESFLIIDSGFTIGYNVALLFLMIPSFRRIRVPRRGANKLGAWVNAFFGTCAIVASVMRLFTLLRIQPTDTEPIPLIGLFYAAIWNLMEAGLTVICTGMPGFWTFIPRQPRPQTVRPRLFVTTRGANINIVPVLERVAPTQPSQAS